MDRQTLKDAYTRMIEEYGAYIFNICYHVLGNEQDAEGAAQETFIKMFQNIERFDEAKGRKNWVCTIALNAARDVYRKNKVRQGRTLYGVDVDAIADERYGPDSAQQRLNIEKMLAGLELKFRTVVVLFYMERMSIEEMSRVLRKPAYLVKVWLYRARKKMLTMHKGLGE